MKKNKVDNQYTMSKLNNPVLNYNVYVLSKAERLLVSVALFVAGGLVAVIFFSGLFKTVDGFPTLATRISDTVCFTVLGLLAIKFGLPVYVNNRLEKRKNTIKLQFREMLQSLTASFSSGSNVQSAFESCYSDLLIQFNENDYIVKEMKEILDGMAQNYPVEEMLSDFAKRTDNEDILCFADVFSVCYRKGGDINTVISRTNTVLTDKMAIMDEINTKLTSNKLQHVVMSLMPIVVVGMLKYTNPSFASSFATPLGVIVNIIALGIFIGSFLFGNKICQIKV